MLYVRKSFILTFLLSSGIVFGWNSYKAPSKEQIKNALQKISKKSFHGEQMVTGWPLVARYANSISYSLGIGKEEYCIEYAVLLDLNPCPMPRWVNGTLITSGSDRIEQGLNKPISLVTFRRKQGQRGQMEYSFNSYILPPGKVGLKFDTGGNAHQAPLSSLFEIREVSPARFIQKAKEKMKEGDVDTSNLIIQGLIQLYPLAPEAKESHKILDDLRRVRELKAADEARQESERIRLQDEEAREELATKRAEEIARVRNTKPKMPGSDNKQKFDAGKKLLWAVKNLVDDGDYEGATEKVLQAEKTLSPNDPFLKEAKSLLKK